MKKQWRRILAVGGVCLWLTSACATAASTPTATPISHVYAFGDSYSDNGNMKKLLPSGPPWNLMWEGRVSNGPVAVEVLATRLNVPLTDCLYAVRAELVEVLALRPSTSSGGSGRA